MTSLKAKIEAIEELQREIIRDAFRGISTLEDFHIDRITLSELCLARINGCSINPNIMRPVALKTAELEQFIRESYQSEETKSWLVEANITLEDFILLHKALGQYKKYIYRGKYERAKFLAGDKK